MSWQLDCKIRYYSCMCHIKVRGTVWLYIMHMDMIDGKGTTWCYVKAPANPIHLKKKEYFFNYINNSYNARKCKHEML